jgi:hypothetical protein
MKILLLSLLVFSAAIKAETFTVNSELSACQGAISLGEISQFKNAEMTFKDADWSVTGGIFNLMNLAKNVAYLVFHSETGEILHKEKLAELQENETEVTIRLGELKKVGKTASIMIENDVTDYEAVKELQEQYGLLYMPVCTGLKILGSINIQIPRGGEQNEIDAQQL